MKRNLYIILLCLPLCLRAGGGQWGAQGQQAMSMGGSVTGLALDGSSVFFNPGALIKLDGAAVNAGMSVIMPKTVFRGPYGGNENTTSSLLLPAYVYGTYKFKERLAFGLGVNTPFGFDTQWEDNWSGRYVSQYTRMSTICIQPTAAFKINERLSLGGGLVITRGIYEQRRALNVQQSGSPEAGVQLNGSGSGIGANVGVFAAWDKTSVGVTYRTATDLSIDDGEVVFSDIPVYFSSSGAYPTGTVFSSAIRLPSVLSFGLGRAVDEKLKLNLDVNLYAWKKSEPIQYSVDGRTYLTSEMMAMEGTCFAVRVGGHYRYSAKIALLAGVAFEQTPVNEGDLSPQFPDADRFVFSGGATYKVRESLSLQAALRFENMRERRQMENFTGQLNGTYKSITYSAGIGINYSF